MCEVALTVHLMIVAATLRGSACDIEEINLNP
jgi:hypothetical protein